MDYSVPSSFSVQMYGNLTPYEGNNAMSKGRMRAFYQGGNRNGSFFTDTFAQHLIEQAEGQPIVGAFNVEEDDFTSHCGIEGSKGYGFVPKPCNFAWEEHYDSDGVKRTYACFDVVLWTHRDPIAARIPSQPQSMEFDPRPGHSKGTWGDDEGRPTFIFESATLIGFCVLGKDVEPCFEGAAFYGFDAHFNLYLTAMRDTIRDNFTSLRDEGGNQMEDTNIENTTVEPVIEPVEVEFEEKAPAPEVEPELTDVSVEPEVFEENEPEQPAPEVEAEPSFESNEETAPEVEPEATEQATDNYAAMVRELTEELVKANSQLVTLNAAFEAATTELNEFRAAKAAAELSAKMELIESYREFLSDDEYAAFTANADATDHNILEGQLAIVFVRQNRANPTLIEDVPNEPKPAAKTGLESILSKYVNKQ